MRRLWRHMLELSQRRQRFAVATIVGAQGSVPGKLGATMVVAADGTAHGTVGGAGLEEKIKKACLEAIQGGQGGLHEFDLAHWKPGGLDSVCGGTVHVSVLVHRPLPHLLLFGGGHCAAALAEIARTVEWDVSVVDERPEYANPQRFPDAVGTHAQDPIQFAATADLGDYSHAYLLGHSHELDVRTLAALLPRFGGVVGAIGSASKRESFRKRLGLAGVAPEHVERVVCPLGVGIGAESPEEIAVSIAAEVIQGLKATPRAIRVSA